MFTEFGWEESNLPILIALHDVLEVVEGYTLSILQEQFELTSEEVVVIELLACKLNETSEENFYRVLSSQNILALKVKYLDCMDNALMDIEDYEWYRTVLNKSVTKEMDKYLARADLIVKYLVSQGY